MPAPRTGSIARNAISQTPFASASTTLPAASKVTNSMGTASRFATSRASSAETPRGSPLAGSFCASTVLPKLIAARSLPVGASSLTTLRGTLSAMAAPHTREKRKESRRADEASALLMQRSSDRLETIRACLHCKAARPHSYACTSTRERNDGQDYQDQSRRHFQAVFELFACGDGRGRAEARVLRGPSRGGRGRKSVATRRFRGPGQDGDGEPDEGARRRRRQDRRRDQDHDLYLQPARRAEGARHSADLFRGRGAGQHAVHSARACQSQFPLGDRGDRRGVTPGDSVTRSQ